MAGSRARTHWSRGGRWVFASFPAGAPELPRPFLPLLHARPQPGSLPGPGSRGGWEGGEEEKGGARGGPRLAAPGLLHHRTCPHLHSPAPPHPPSSPARFLGLCLTVAKALVAPWILPVP